MGSTTAAGRGEGRTKPLQGRYGGRTGLGCDGVQAAYTQATDQKPRQLSELFHDRVRGQARHCASPATGIHQGP